MEALISGYRSEAWKAELTQLDERKATTLSAGLEHDAERDAARQALREFLESIVIPLGDGLLQVVGNFGEMLKAADAKGRPGRAVGIDGCGAGFEPATFGL
jgi:hypothetical protein